MFDLIYHNKLFWFGLVIFLLGLDYLLIYCIENKNPKSNNIYFKLNKKLGNTKTSIIRLIYFIFVVHNFMSPYKLSHEHAKTIIIIYCVVIITLLYDFFKKKERSIDEKDSITKLQ